jgi:CubicO group peptidase (beta-lactamase class C family)
MRALLCSASVFVLGALGACNVGAPSAVAPQAPPPVPARAPAASLASGASAPGASAGKTGPSGRVAHPFDAARAAALDAFIEDALARTGVPGAAIAVVQGGKVVHERAFGTREAGKSLPVTPDTLFMIGSATKPLTSLMVAKLVDEGKLTWSTPVQEIMPSFAIADPEASRAMTVENTLCACAGLPRVDAELFFAPRAMSPEERIASMRLMKPTARIGEKYQYSNVMVAAAGYIAAHAAVPEKRLGPAYQEAMQSRVFGPLGMTKTTLDPDVATAKDVDHATPHGATMEGAYVPIPLADEAFVAPIRPSGGVWSSVHDMSRYVALELAKGKDESGRALYSEANLVKRREPQVDSGEGTSYGLGLWVDTSAGNQWLGHTGGTLGFRSRIFVFPEFDWGYVLLANATDDDFGPAVQGRLHELIFDRPSHASAALEHALAASRGDADKLRAQYTKSPPPEWVASLAGTYQDATLGKIAVRAENGKGVLDAGAWKSAFGKLTKNGRSGLILLDPPHNGFVFYPEDAGGAPRKASLVLETPEASYVFAREGAGGTRTASNSR